MYWYLTVEIDGIKLLVCVWRIFLGSSANKSKHLFQYLATVKDVRRPLLKGFFVKLTWVGKDTGSRSLDGSFQVLVDCYLRLGNILVLHLDSLVILLLFWGWCLNVSSSPSRSVVALFIFVIHLCHCHNCGYCYDVIISRVLVIMMSIVIKAVDLQQGEADRWEQPQFLQGLVRPSTPAHKFNIRKQSQSYPRCSPSGCPTCPSLHWIQRYGPGSCCSEFKLKMDFVRWFKPGPSERDQVFLFKDNLNLDPVRGMAKRWQVVMDSPIARGAEPCGKYLIEIREFKKC